MFSFHNTLLMLIQLSLYSFAAAAPISTESHGNGWRYGAPGGVVGFIVLILDIIVFSKQQPAESPSCLWLSATLVVPTPERSSPQIRE
jgi:hypothetical protein